MAYGLKVNSKKDKADIHSLMEISMKENGRMATYGEKELI
jgi:hypothetical protein